MRIIVLGSGDMVRHRLLPALLSAGVDGEMPIRKLESILLISSDLASPLLPTHSPIRIAWCSVTSVALGDELKSADAVIVATPSFVHLPYIRQACCP